ncbi:sulfotransferase [Bacteroidota bacterium]
MKVNAIVIGAGRSGTTSLCSMMEDHPDICFSVIKELHYFSVSDLYQRGEKYYHSFFRNYKQETILASADTYLLIDHSAPHRIHNYNPDMKIIVLLRDPVLRAFSSYNYSVNYGHHAAYGSFIDSLREEKEIEQLESIIDRNNLGHFYGSLYAKHLEPWVKVFGSDQVLCLMTSDLKEAPDKLQHTLCQFLRISEVLTKPERKNPNAVPKSKRLENFLLNREGPLRSFIRFATPSFLKRWIIHSGVVDKLHEVNRIPQEAEKLDEDVYKTALEWFAEDLMLLKENYGIVLKEKSSIGSE